MEEPGPLVAPRSRGSWARRIAHACTALATVGLAATLVVPLVPLWPMVLFAHFRFQYLVAGVVICVAAAALRSIRWFDVAAVATLVTAILWVLPDLNRTPRPVPADGIPVRVLLLNVHTSSTSHEAVRRLITEVNADVVGLLEVDRRWLDELAPTVAGYRLRLEAPRDDNFGVALYARFDGATTVEPLGSELPTAVVDLDLDPRGSARLHVLLVHPIPPVNPAALRAQAAHLQVVADRATVHTPEPVIVVGDLNATPWSTPFRVLVRQSGLCDTRAGFGLQTTFPAGSTLTRIPIDHVLASCSIGVRDRRIGPDVGSDHLPVIVDLVVPRRRPSS